MMESSDEEEDDMLTIKRKDHEIQDDDGKIINRLSRRKRGMVSNPLFIIPDSFPFKPKVTIPEFFWKMQRKSGIPFRVGRQASFSQIWYVKRYNFEFHQ